MFTPRETNIILDIKTHVCLHIGNHSAHTHAHTQIILYRINMILSLVKLGSLALISFPLLISQMI